MKLLLGMFLFCSAAMSFAATDVPDTLISQQEGWTVRSIMNVGDTAANGYRMVGIPDGLGAYSETSGVMTVLMNHEIAQPSESNKYYAGITRKQGHGAKGAFISRWNIDIETLKVESGEDLIKQVYLWDAKKNQYQVKSNEIFSRFCSADLAPKGTFYDSQSGLGYRGQFFLNGEEDKETGRAFAHSLDGSTYELPHLGKIQWENVVAHPNTGKKTLVIGMDDNHEGGFILVYVGEKRKDGNPVEKAGLVGGKVYAVKKTDGNDFKLIPLDDVASKNIAHLRIYAFVSGATLFPRPEDGAWDTQQKRNTFYFATTNEFGANTQIYKLAFDDVLAPEKGGKIEVVLNGGRVGAEMFDNLTVDAQGHLFIQEDPGNNSHLAAIWQLDPYTKVAKKLFIANPDLFDAGQPGFKTVDEEHSGIIEVTPLLSKASWFDSNKRYFLGTTQIHCKAKVDKNHCGLEESHVEELIEPGQLWLISGPKSLM